MQLLLQATWKTTDPTVLLLAQQRAWTLISMFDECSSSSLPFACGGDLDFSSSPYGSWSAITIGTWIVTQGWVGTCCKINGTTHYAGLFLQIDFTDPVVPSNLHLVYDMTVGQFTDPHDVSGVHVYDPLNGYTIGTPIEMGSLVNGAAQVYDSGAGTLPTTRLWILISSGAESGADPFPEGSVFLHRADISGTAHVPPC